MNVKLDGKQITDAISEWVAKQYGLEGTFKFQLKIPKEIRGEFFLEVTVVPQGELAAKS